MQSSQKMVGLISTKSQDCNLLSSSATSVFRGSDKEKALSPLAYFAGSVNWFIEHPCDLLYIQARL